MKYTKVMNWKNIKEHEGRYQISDDGQVKFLGDKFHKERILKPSLVGSGYPSVQLGKKGKRFLVHRLVGAAFCKIPKLQINHKDGDKKNNNYTNLEWVTCKENLIHALRTKLRVPFKGENHWSSKLKEKQVQEIRKLKKEGYTYEQLSLKYNVSNGCISGIINNKTWKL